MATEKGFDYVKATRPSVTNTTPFWELNDTMDPFHHEVEQPNDNHGCACKRQ